MCIASVFFLAIHINLEKKYYRGRTISFGFQFRLASTMADAENRNAQASRFQKESHDDGEKDPQELSAVFVDVIVDDENSVPVHVASVCVRDVRDANVHCCKPGQQCACLRAFSRHVSLRSHFLVAILKP